VLFYLFKAQAQNIVSRIYLLFYFILNIKWLENVEGEKRERELHDEGHTCLAISMEKELCAN
jgi:hypothetical protein